MILQITVKHWDIFLGHLDIDSAQFRKAMEGNKQACMFFI